ncbi:MAG: sigma-70 family RNA polymerase sigma factor [Planctomycetaceae bacterium]|nr:sigma-70 family RNA polymerase sigma factor [Planctomycetaceae bacterium]
MASPLSQEFVREFTRTQRPLYLFILAQVGDAIRAEEILQDTNVVLLSKHQQFREGTNFLAWARQVATFEVLQSRQRQRRDKLRFSEEFVTAVANDAAEESDLAELRRKALQECLQALKADDRELIQRRYQPGSSGKELAEDLGRPANSVYQSLSRIRRSLLDCVERRVAQDTV